MNGKKAWMLAGAVGIGAVSGCAGPKEAGRDIESATPGLAQHAQGTVEQVDAQDGLLAIRSPDSSTPGQPIWVHVVPDTKMERNGQRIALQDLKPGDMVRVSFDRRAGPEQAIDVELLSGTGGSSP